MLHLANVLIRISNIFRPWKWIILTPLVNPASRGTIAHTAFCTGISASALAPEARRAHGSCPGVLYFVRRCLGIGTCWGHEQTCPKVSGGAARPAGAAAEQQRRCREQQRHSLVSSGSIAPTLRPPESLLPPPQQGACLGQRWSAPAAALRQAVPSPRTQRKEPLPLRCWAEHGHGCRQLHGLPLLNADCTMYFGRYVKWAGCWLPLAYSLVTRMPWL